ncbi:MAG: hypothetical protein FD189_2152 [Elusimicrobia bacterium]|nr:MAG: hypothetical protein FD154_2166 [Elusimicrobiota bacterium]KAF0153981.1 MAG: hypothetical protein FD189_2152 [Elusimicrobiota bacterium]
MDIGSAGVSAIWVLANISYAGMRAQNNPDVLWRIFSFIFGLPGSIVTLLAVREGSMRAYGINLGFAAAPGKEDRNDI